MNYYPFHIGEPYQSQLIDAIKDRDEATTAAGKSGANSRIRSIRLEAAREKGTHTREQWDALVKAMAGRCVMCGAGGPSVHLEKDHVIPVYQGGSDGMENIQPLCKPCNAAKGPDTTNWVLYRIEHGFEG